MKVLATASALALAATAASAVTITITNKCATSQGLWDNAALVPLAPGASTTRGLPNNGFKGMFRSGSDPHATLAEFSTDGREIWYDLSIIPPGSGNCKGHANCVRQTGGLGFNIPMQIAPRKNLNGKNCRVVTCLAEGCPDAYQDPTDDQHAMADCPVTTDIDVIFCPNGPGAPATTPTPTTQTPAPTTPKPTTPAPTTTPVPTTTAPPTTTPPPPPTPTPEPSATATEAPVQHEQQVLTPELTTAAPTDAPEGTAEAVGTPAAETPVEVNTQTSTSNGSPVGTYMVLLLGAVGCVGAAVIVVVRRKKAELDDLNIKSPIDVLSSPRDMSTVCML